MQSQEKRGTILIVDDEITNLDLLVGLLKPHYKTIAATNGDRALRRLRKGPLPDLILLDVVMPDMNGFEVCRRLKADKGTRHIPVIFLTARDSSGDIVSGFNAGAVDYVTKPFRPEELRARVDTHMRLTKTISAYENALKEIKTLKGMLPICSACKKIRDDRGYWNQLEDYIMAHSEAEFTHGICPECIKIHYPDFDIPRG